MEEDLDNNFTALQSFPEELHWYCPRVSKDDDTVYDETEAGEAGNDMPLEYQKRLKDGISRRRIAVDCLLIASFDDEKLQPRVQFLKDGMSVQLGRCEDCIERYYEEKSRLLERLSDYAEDMVKQFFDIIDGWDLERLAAGLTSALKQLNAMNPKERSFSRLDPQEMFAIFETLASEPALKRNGFLVKYFDKPFELCQTLKGLKVMSYVPAMGYFLFSNNLVRYQWAQSNWSRQNFPQLTVAIFDQKLRNSIQDGVLKAREAPKLDSLPKFWQSIRLIVEKMNKELISHSLRGLDENLYVIALDHLQLHSAAVHQILGLLRQLLIISPQDFWDALGTINAQSVVENAFRSTYLRDYFLAIGEDGSSEGVPLQETTNWIFPFMKSLKAPVMPMACRAFSRQFFGEFQSVERGYPDLVKSYFASLGFKIIALTLNALKDGFTADTLSVSRYVVSEVMSIVEDYKDILIASATMPETDLSTRALSSAAVDALLSALDLDCSSMTSDMEHLVASEVLDDTPGQFSKKLWEELAKKIRPHDIVLGKTALIAMNAFVGLEEIKVPTARLQNGSSESDDNIRQCRQFNKSMNGFVEVVAEILQKISQFDPLDLDSLYSDQATATALIGALFSSNMYIFDGAVDVLKSVSSQATRLDAMVHILTSFLSPTIKALIWTIRRIESRKIFVSFPPMLKIGGNILDALCSDDVGILKKKNLTSTAEASLVSQFWLRQWHSLKTIFQTTELWSQFYAKEKEELSNFCRDTMQHADKLFDYFSIFRYAIESVQATQGEVSVAEVLLRQTTLTLNYMVKWLRLSDSLLLEIITGLICKILHRLAELKMTVDEGSLDYVRRVVTRNQTKTNLEPQQKARLGIAVDRFRVTKPSTANTVQGVKQTKQTKQSSIIGYTTPSNKQEVVDLDDSFSDVKNGADVYTVYRDGSIKRSTSQPSAGPGHPAPQGHVQTPLSGSVEGKLSFRERRAAKDAATIQREAQKQKERDAFLETRRREKMEMETKKREARLARNKLNANEGSALSSLRGVAGVDHTPAHIKSSIMVSSGSESGSESDSDSDASGSGLFTEIAKARPSTAKSGPERVKEAALKNLVQGPTKMKRHLKTDKAMRARVNPDMSPLHKTILGWNFFSEGDFPPNSEKSDYSLVRNSFNDPREYQQVFQQLHALEAWQGIQKEKEELTDARVFEVKIGTRIAVDAFVEIQCTMDQVKFKESNLSPGDLVLISRGDKPLREPSRPNCLARVLRSNFKKAQGKNISEVTYRLKPNASLSPSLTPGGTFKGMRITSLVSLEREYSSLLGLEYYDLCTEIVQGKISPIPEYKPNIINAIASNYEVNFAQAKAIKCAIDNDYFTLIQGPPGSGKTKTIVAIVGALLSDKVMSQPQARPVIIPTPKHQNVATPAVKKLLVCAPSNAAVDELVMRFKGGVRDLTGKHRKISVIRLGRSDVINANIKDVTLDVLIQNKLDSENKAKPVEDVGADINTLVEKMRERGAEVDVLYDALNAARAKGEDTKDLERSIEEKKREKRTLGEKTDRLRDSKQQRVREADEVRKRAQKEILNGADVLCATLSGSGHEMFQNMDIEFETVIIDEAAQSVEVSALIPLKYGCVKCILVGDPKQLPPTVISREAQRLQYEQSLFVRMQDNHKDRVLLLDVQYRMHPEISSFPSKTFYDNLLKDGDGMAALRKKPWHASELLAPYRFCDVQGQQQNAAKGHSLINMTEVSVAVRLYDRLRHECPTYDFTGKIGIITPYKAQLRELQQRFTRRYGDKINDIIDFNTTDAFQGRESEIIIFSCVRASDKGVGFVGDIRRMNVGLTRAKSSLWILGNSRALVTNDFWRRLVEDAKERNRYSGGANLASFLNQPMVKPDAFTQPISPQDVEMVDAPSEEPNPKRVKLKARRAVPLNDQKPGDTPPKSPPDDTLDNKYKPESKALQTQTKKEKDEDNAQDTSIGSQKRKRSPSLKAPVATFRPGDGPARPPLRLPGNTNSTANSPTPQNSNGPDASGGTPAETAPRRAGNPPPRLIKRRNNRETDIFIRPKKR